MKQSENLVSIDDIKDILYSEFKKVDTEHKFDTFD